MPRLNNALLSALLAGLAALIVYVLIDGFSGTAVAVGVVAAAAAGLTRWFVTRR